MYKDRREIYDEIGLIRGSKVLAYVTGDRRDLETIMSSEVLDFFVQHLDQIGVVETISLVLYTRGGETLSAWSIANLLRTFCDRLEVIIPAKCHSAGTLLCLGADSIVMTKQATLGPIDPSVNTPLNPPLTAPGGQPAGTVPLSVEDVNAFLEHAKESLNGEPLNQIFDRLATSVHPLVLGRAYRARAQIRMLGERLLKNHMTDAQKITKILDFLCSESGGHDYTINRREARRDLGLPIETPSWEFYRTIKRLYDDFANELELSKPYDPSAFLRGVDSADYDLRRAMIESPIGGSHTFVSQGTIALQEIEVAPGVFQNAVNDQRTFEGWRFSDA